MNEVELYINDQEDLVRDLLIELRHLVLDNVAQARESIKWQIPFYEIPGRNLCYLNPQKDHVVLGFYDGAQLSDEQGILTGEGNMVRKIEVRELDEGLRLSISEVIHEAVLIAEQMVKKKK